MRFEKTLIIRFSVPMPLQTEAAPGIEDSNFRMESFDGEDWMTKSSFEFPDKDNNFIGGEELGNHSTADTTGKYRSAGLEALMPRKGRYYCTYKGCTQSFSRPKDRERHLKKHYPEERVFICPEKPCAMRFYRRDKLMDHSRRVHGARGGKGRYMS
jgi:hypothetical protein